MYTLKSIIDGCNIETNEYWTHDGITGNKVSVHGYKVSIKGFPYEFANSMAVLRLKKLISKERFNLTNAVMILNGVLHCNVILNDINISNYFCEFEK